MKSCFAVLALLSAWLAYPIAADAGGYGRSFVQTAPAGGVLIVNNNNNNARDARVDVQVRTRAFRPVARFFFPRAAIRRDLQFGVPVDRFGNARGPLAR